MVCRRRSPVSGGTGGAGGGGGGAGGSATATAVNGGTGGGAVSSTIVPTGTGGSDGTGGAGTGGGGGGAITNTQANPGGAANGSPGVGGVGGDGALDGVRHTNGGNGGTGGSGGSCAHPALWRLGTLRLLADRRGRCPSAVLPSWRARQRSAGLAPVPATGWARSLAPSRLTCQPLPPVGVLAQPGPAARPRALPMGYYSDTARVVSAAVSPNAVRGINPVESQRTYRVEAVWHVGVTTAAAGGVGTTPRTLGADTVGAGKRRRFIGHRNIFGLIGRRIRSIR